MLFQVQGPTSGKLGSLVRFDLAKDDFWHASAFSTVQKYALGKERQSTLGLLQPSADRLKEAELQADAYGLLYSTWAGYSPQRLLAQPDSFFEQWAAATGEGSDTAHPAPAVRAGFLRNQLAQVTEDLDYFHFGARLLELGRYEDALLLLERFKDSFASREVFTDIGLAHHQLALRELARCDGQLAMRFALPVEADPTTLAERTRLRGAGDDRAEQACLDGPVFREHVAAARRYLELACERDASYLAARIDLVATLLLARRNAEAMLVADDGLKLAPGSAELLDGKAVAFYLFGLESRFETTDGALKMLDQAAKYAPRSPAVLYNRAVILEERGRTAAAHDAWLAFLAVDPASPLSEVARQRAGATGSAVPAPPVAAVGPSSPLPVGALSASTRERLRGFTEREFVLGDFRGSFLSGTLASGGSTAAPRTDALQALAIGAALELVEVAPGAKLSRAEALARYGAPARTVATPHGEVLVYRAFALSYVGEALDATLFFAAAAAR